MDVLNLIVINILGKIYSTHHKDSYKCFHVGPFFKSWEDELNDPSQKKEPPE